MNFDNFKRDCLARADKSKKKSIDLKIKPLIDFINSLPNYCTTSSCSGRILVIEKRSYKKQESKWLFVSHKPTSFLDIKKALQKTSGDVWFKQESFILHICCRTLEDAKNILGASRDIGIKRAGIISLGSKIMVEVIGTEAIEALIAKGGKLLVDDNYLRILTEEANKKLERNSKRIELFYNEIKKITSS